MNDLPTGWNYLSGEKLEARDAIALWAKDYWQTENLRVSRIYSTDEGDGLLWHAEIMVAADRHTVDFWLDEHHRLVENRLHVETVDGKDL